MNKNIAMLIAAVLLFAMALIAVNQFNSGNKDVPALDASVPVPSVTGQVTGQPPVDSNANGTMPQAVPLAPSGLMPLDNGTLRELPPTGMQAGNPGALAGVSAGEEDAPVEPEVRQAPAAKPVAKAAAPKVEQAAPKQAAKKDSAKAAPAAKPSEAKAAPAAKQATAAKESAKEASKPAVKPVEAKTSAAKAAPATPAPGKSSPGAHAAKALIKFDGSTAILLLEGNADVHYKTFVLKEPERMVVDLDGAWDVKAPVVPSNRVIKAVRVGRPGAEKTRIVLDLEKQLEKHDVVKVNAKTLEVRVK